MRIRWVWGDKFVRVEKGVIGRVRVIVPSTAAHSGQVGRLVDGRLIM